MGAPIGWAPLEYRHEYALARLAGASVLYCRPSRAQLLFGAQMGGALVVPRGFLANATDALPLVDGAGSTPVAATCRVNPAFRQPPFGNGRALVCPITSPACELAETKRLAMLARRFYNLTLSTLKRRADHHPRRSLVRCGQSSSGVACAGTLRALWACLRQRNDTRECERRFIVQGK
jgi:hypothetical protein